MSIHMSARMSMHMPPSTPTHMWVHMQVQQVVTRSLSKLVAMARPGVKITMLGYPTPTAFFSTAEGECPGTSPSVPRPPPPPPGGGAPAPPPSPPPPPPPPSARSCGERRAIFF